MTTLSKIVFTLIGLLFAVRAVAGPIAIDPLQGGEHPDQLGGYAMTPFQEPNGSSTCTPSPIGGDVCFEDYWGNPVELIADDPWWWEYDGAPGPDHGNIFVVLGHNWIDLILPAKTRAISLFVGASFDGRAWIQAYNDVGYQSTRKYFDIDVDDTRGYGIHATDCSALTRVTVEPYAWGFGYLAINQGACQSVAEPAPILLLGLGILGMAVARRLHRARVRHSKSIAENLAARRFDSPFL